MLLARKCHVQIKRAGDQLPGAVLRQYPPGCWRRLESQCQENVVPVKLFYMNDNLRDTGDRVCKTVIVFIALALVLAGADIPALRVQQNRFE